MTTRTNNNQRQTISILLSTGLSVWKGTVSEEYLADLKPWSKAVKIYKEMSEDVVIGTLYESIKTPLLDARFTITPASQSAPDLKAADWLRQQTIDSTSFSWLNHVEEMLTFLEYGFAIAEKVLEKSTSNAVFDLLDLVPIGQDSLYKWGDMDSRGFPKSFTQQVTAPATSPKTITAPMHKLLHFVYGGHKRNPQGRSLSRSLYRPWYFAKNLQVVEAIGAERDIGNVPVFRLGEGAYTDADITRLKEAGEGLRMDETAYIILPHGVDASPFGAGGKVYDVRGIVRDYQHLIRQRFFMDFVSFGTEGVGTQALAKEVTSFFSLALASVQRRMLEVWNTQLVPWLFRWNQAAFPGISGLPKISWAKPGKINVQSVAQAVATLTGAGIIHFNQPLEDKLREDFELPPITEDEVRETATSPRAPQAPEPPGEIRGGDEAQKLSSKES